MNARERLERFLSKEPVIPESAYVAPEATVIGDVALGEQASVWPGAVLRGDINSIRVGDRSNVQDGTVVHLADDCPAEIGRDVTIGHRAIVHACRVEDEGLIGMGATLLDGAVIGRRSIVGANALVTQGTVVPPGSLLLGMPAKVVRCLGEEEQLEIAGWAKKYLLVAAAHKARGR